MDRNQRMDQNRRNEWLRRLEEECPYQVVLSRRPLSREEEVLRFLDAFVGKFDMYVEGESVHYCFADSSDAAFFRARFAQRSERSKLAG
jgi:hypothetical protein